MTFVKTQEIKDIEEEFLKGNSFKIGAIAGSGKAQPNNCVVKTPSGEREIGALVAGDDILSKDGKIQKVTGVFPQGKKQVYKVTFRDKTSTEVCGDHLWEVSKITRRVNPFITTTKEILEDGVLTSDGKMKYRIPLCDPIEYIEKDYDIHPYVIGALIGDGCLCGDSLAFSCSSQDLDNMQRVKENLPEGITFGGDRSTSENCRQAIIVDEANFRNTFKVKIKELGLDVKSGDKFIPFIYFFGSVQQRLDILRGLMDTDGTCSKNRTSFSTTSPQLCKDVCELVRGLGGVAIENKPVVREGKSTEFCVNVKMNICPFYNKRKKSSWRVSTKNPPSRYIRSIEKLPKFVDMTCISVSSEDHLYLTNDFIVTHNTTACVNLANQTDKRCLMLVFNKSNAEEAKKKLPYNVICKTTHSLAWGSRIDGESQVLGKVYENKLKRPSFSQGYRNVAGTATEIAKFYKVKGNETVNPNKIAFMAKAAVSYFESSADSELEDKHLPSRYMNDIVMKHKGKKGTISYKELKALVLPLAKKLSKDRLDPKSVVLCSHDTYLKRFQLSNPKLGYDVIFLDEAQDTTDVVLDIIQKQKAQQIYVGDKNQAIYGWRGAINAMEKVDLKALPLTQSWRYGQAVAEVATRILDNGVIVVGNPDIKSTIGRVDTSEPYCHLFRTGIALLDRACDLANEGVEVKIEFDYKDFMKKLSSAQALFEENKKGVKHEEIKLYGDWDEFVLESEGNGENSRIVNMIKQKKAKKVLFFLNNYNEPYDYDVILTTAHKSKGREFSQVILGNDFPDLVDDDGFVLPNLQEEINLAYVACTRAIDVLELNLSINTLLSYRN